MRRWFVWLIAPLPLLVGLAAFGLLTGLSIPNPVLYLRADLGTVLLLVGIALTVGLLVVIGVWWMGQGQIREQGRLAQREVRNEYAEEHRRFLQRLDHEVKNPLMGIRAGLANLRDLVPDPQVADSLESVDAQVLRLSRLLKDLRKLADLEHQPIERMPVNLEELLEEVLAVAGERPEAAERNMQLTLPQAPWPIPTVQADWDLLFLAIHNLVDNALKYTLPGNTIEVRAFEDGASVVIEVADTGPGIPEAELPHVWEELSRGYSARGVPGSGLGLALVRTVAERHGGRVTLRSRAGYGTVFSVRIPMA